MAKKFNNKNEKRLERTIMRNWIIMGVSLALIIIFVVMSKAG